MQMNKCPYCGGQIVMEYFGDYGLVYKMKSNGELSKKPIRKFMYETHGDDPEIYCWECRKAISISDLR